MIDELLEPPPTSPIMPYKLGRVCVPDTDDMDLSTADVVARVLVVPYGEPSENERKIVGEPSGLIRAMMDELCTRFFVPGFRCCDYFWNLETF